MKIVHIAPNAPYNDYWGYQDNLLPKYHKKLGHDVAIIVTNTTHKDGKIVETEPGDYVLNDGVRVIRLKRKKKLHRRLTQLRAYLPIYSLLEQLMPDFIFFHGMLSTSIYDVIKYKKKCNPDCVVVQDNHLDYNIGYAADSFIEKIFRAYHRHVNRISVKHVDRIYGVTPWRKTYAEDYFAIPKEKTDVLIMGADDEKIDFASKEKIRASIRDSYGITDSDFLIVTGGKIDRKKKIHYLMEACAGLPNVKLLIFGHVSDDIKTDFDSLLNKNPNIIYIGWVESDRVYDYFFASDLVFFPGQHSVLWEQACASKVPCVFEKWEGMDHVDAGGNSDFVAPINPDTLRDKINELCFTEKYFKMKEISESSVTDVFLYSKIAEKSLESAAK